MSLQGGVLLRRLPSSCHQHEHQQGEMPTLDLLWKSEAKVEISVPPRVPVVSVREDVQRQVPPSTLQVNHRLVNATTGCFFLLKTLCWAKLDDMRTPHCVLANYNFLLLIFGEEQFKKAPGITKL